MAFDYSVRFEAIDKISNVVDKINNKVDILKNKAKDAVNIKAINQQATDKLNQVIDKVNSLKNKAKEIINVMLNNRQAMNSLNQVHNKIKEFSKKPIDITLSFASLVSSTASLALPLKKAIEIETAFSGITKAVDGTDEQMAKLRTDLIDMTKYMPRTISELMSIAEAGGKMGIPIDKLTEFTDVVAKTSVAFDMPIKDINEAFGSFKSLLGYGIPQYKQYGDIVNKLADSTSADAKRIVDISQRASSAFGSLNFDVATVAGLSAFADQMSISSEVGGTAMASMLEKIRGTKDGLKLLTEQGGYGLIKVVDRFKELKGIARTNAIADLFGSGEEARLFEKLINRTEVLKESLDIAFSTDTLGSMQREFEKVSNTTANKIKLLTNSVERISLKIGDALLPDLNAMIETIAPIISKIESWVKLNKDLIITISKILAVSIALTAGFLLIKIMLIPVLLAIRTYMLLMQGLSIALSIAKTAMFLFNAVFLANPIGLIVLAVTALVVGIGYLIGGIDGAKQAFLNLISPITIVMDLIDSLLSKLDIYNNLKNEIKDIGATVETKVSGAWEDTKGFFGFANDNQTNVTPTSNDVQIDNTNKNHTIVDVNIKSDAGLVTEQNAQSTGGRVKLNTASNGV